MARVLNWFSKPFSMDVISAVTLSLALWPWWKPAHRADPTYRAACWRILSSNVLQHTHSKEMDQQLAARCCLSLPSSKLLICLSPDPGPRSSQIIPENNLANKAWALAPRYNGRCGWMLLYQTTNDCYISRDVSYEFCTVPVCQALWPLKTQSGCRNCQRRLQDFCIRQSSADVC